MYRGFAGGEEISLEDFEGPSDEELRQAYKRSGQRQRARIVSVSATRQSNPQRVIGTPRHRKHKGRLL